MATIAPRSSTADRAHDLTNCHDSRHAAANCPACHGVKIACRTHQTPSAQAKTATPSGTEAGAPGEEVETRSPATPSRPAATERVTYDSPFAVEQDVTDDDWTVTVGLTHDAARQLARDLYRHRRDLLTYFRMRMQAEERHATPEDRQAARETEARLAGALQSTATTQWTLTPIQAEEHTADLQEAQADRETCIVGTCTALAAIGSYCGSHYEVL